MMAAIIAALLAIPGVQAEPGATTATFLLVPVGGRPVALGGAYTALAEDAYAMHYNPGAMARAPREIVFAHNEHLLDMSQEYLAATFPLNVGVLGASINYFNLGKFDRAIISNTAAPGTPNSYALSGRFSASNLAASIGYSRDILMPGLSGGITAKYIRQDIDNYDGATFAVDMGLYYHKKDHPLSLGFSVLNLGDKLRMRAREDDLPLTFRLGGAYRVIPEKLLFTADLSKTVKDDQYYAHIGGEYWIAEMIALRIGYDAVSSAGNGLRAGVGFRANQFSLDYAFSDEGALKQAHRISVGYRF
jgi:hypothetical protein